MEGLVGGIRWRRDLLDSLLGRRLLQRGLELCDRDVAVRHVLDHCDVPRGHARVADPLSDRDDHEEHDQERAQDAGHDDAPVVRDPRSQAVGSITTPRYGPLSSPSFWGGPNFVAYRQEIRPTSM